MTPELIAAIGTAIVTPVIAYMKSQADAQKRVEKRNEQIVLIDQRLQQCEKKSSAIDELKNSIAKVEVGMSRLEAILEMIVKKMP